MRRPPLTSFWHPVFGLTLIAALTLTACGSGDEAPPPVTAPPVAAPAETPAPAAPAESEAMTGAEESMLIQPSLVDTLTVDELLVAAEEAVKEKQLFVPAGESAFEMYISVIEQEPLNVRAKNALSDLFPYAMLYLEQRTAAGDLSESDRVLDLMERANPKAPALPRLKSAINDLRNRVAAETQRAAAAEAAQQRATADTQRNQQQAAAEAEARRLAAEAAEAERRAAQQAVAEIPDPEPTPEPVASAPPPVQQTPPPAPVAPPPAADTKPVTPTAISAVQPRYPPIALRRRIEGSVEVGFTIMPDGSVSNVRVLSSRPNNTFDRESINAMERWRFTPPGREVESRRVFDFKLNE